MGETIAAALVIGSALGQITVNAFAPGNSMPAVIANEWGEADELHKSALIALAVTLFVITIVVNLIATRSPAIDAAELEVRRRSGASRRMIRADRDRPAICARDARHAGASIKSHAS